MEGSSVSGVTSPGSRSGERKLPPLGCKRLPLEARKLLLPGKSFPWKQLTVPQPGSCHFANTLCKADVVNELQHRPAAVSFLTRIFQAGKKLLLLTANFSELYELKVTIGICAICSAALFSGLISLLLLLNMLFKLEHLFKWREITSVGKTILDIFIW